MARRSAFRAASCLLAAMLSLTGFPRVVGASDLPADQEALILTRALAYDRNLITRAGEDLLLAVLVRESDPRSLAAGRQIHASFGKLEKHLVQGLRFRAVLLAYNNAAELEALVIKHDIDVLYVAEGVGSEVGAISKIGRAHDVTTMGTHAELVRAGLCLGAFVFDNQPRILLNRTAAEEEGAAFGANLLRLAKLL